MTLGRFRRRTPLKPSIREKGGGVEVVVVGVVRVVVVVRVEGVVRVEVRTHTDMLVKVWRAAGNYVDCLKTRLGLKQKGRQFNFDPVPPPPYGTYTLDDP